MEFDFLGVIVWILQIYSLAILFWVILSWIRVSPGHPLGALSRFLDRIIYPVILPLRRVIPPVRLGGGMLDLSPIIWLSGISIILSVRR